jgi:hypothetical protein
MRIDRLLQSVLPRSHARQEELGFSLSHRFSFDAVSAITILFVRPLLFGRSCFIFVSTSNADLDTGGHDTSMSRRVDAHTCSSVDDPFEMSLIKPSNVTPYTTEILTLEFCEMMILLPG